MVHGSRVATGAESWLRRRPRVAAKNCCPCPSAPWRAGAAVGERLPERLGTFQEGTAYRARERRRGCHGGALVLVTPGAVVVAVGNVVVEGKGDVVVVAPGAVVVVAPGAVVVVAPGAVVVVGPMVAVVLVTVRTVVVVLLAGAPHASQQLGADPTNAVPPR